MFRPRSLVAPVRADLTEKMVFVAGPRQVGKTTLARQILAGHGDGVYLSCDRREDRREALAARWPAGEALVVLDEVHKLRGWKRWLKGEFDHHRDHLRFLVTGSARLDVYRRGGDSLQGRYRHFRLHPFTYAELEQPLDRPLPEPGEELSIPTRGAASTVRALHRFGGYPEPFLAASERTLRRWQKERLDRFFREDVRDLEAVRELSGIQLLGDLLAERVAAPLSLNALRQDLEASHRAVSHWIEVLERLYFVFRIPPYTAKAIRALRKMPKAYLWDPSLVPDPGARFENLVALHLLKLCHLLEDAEGHRMGLHYLRDVEGREVDFLVTVDRRPWFAVEAKLSDRVVAPTLRYSPQRPRAHGAAVDDALEGGGAGDDGAVIEPERRQGREQAGLLARRQLGRRLVADLDGGERAVAAPHDEVALAVVGEVAEAHVLVAGEVVVDRGLGQAAEVRGEAEHHGVAQAAVDRVDLAGRAGLLARLEGEPRRGRAPSVPSRRRCGPRPGRRRAARPAASRRGRPRGADRAARGLCRRPGARAPRGSRRACRARARPARPARGGAAASAWTCPSGACRTGRAPLGGPGRAGVAPPPPARCRWGKASSPRCSS
ncbi:MAG: ATP-binding protein [Deltaproteobacteria bacterium]|nr:ATP-binding protein [Deltaproteobacteria bacterium]